MVQGILSIFQIYIYIYIYIYFTGRSSSISSSSRRSNSSSGISDISTSSKSHSRYWLSTKLTVKKLVKDKIIYKKDNQFYIFGAKYNSYSNIYKKIIEHWGITPTFNSSQKRDIEIIILKNNELLTKRNNYRTYQDLLNHKLNHKLKKAKELQVKKLKDIIELEKSKFPMYS